MRETWYGPFLLAVLAGATPTQQPVAESHPLAPNGLVRIQLVSGSLRILGGKEPRVEVKGTLGAKVERLEVQASPGRVEIRPVLPSQTKGLKGEELAVHLEFTVPAGCALEASTVSAPLNVAEVTGRLTLRSVSGSVTAWAAAEGPVCPEATVATVSGEARLSLPVAKATVTVVSGRATVGLVADEAVVKSVSGNITFTGGRLRQLQLNAVSGRIEVAAGLAPQGALRVNTVSGAIELCLPADTDAAVSLRTLSGGFSSDFPLPDPPRRPGAGRRVDGVLGEGSGRIEASTLSGPITIRKNP